MAYSEKVIDHYQTQRMWVRWTKAKRTLVPVW